MSPNYEIPTIRVLEISEQIGEGQFGIVYKGKWNGTSFDGFNFQVEEDFLCTHTNDNILFDGQTLSFNLKTKKILIRN